MIRVSQLRSQLLRFCLTDYFCTTSACHRTCLGSLTDLEENPSNNWVKVRAEGCKVSPKTKVKKAHPGILLHWRFLQDPPGYRRCIGTGRWSSSAPLGTPRDTACRTPAGPGPGPRWAGTALCSWQSSLKREKHKPSDPCDLHRNRGRGHSWLKLGLWGWPSEH